IDIEAQQTNVSRLWAPDSKPVSLRLFTRSIARRTGGQQKRTAVGIQCQPWRVRILALRQSDEVSHGTIVSMMHPDVLSSGAAGGFGIGIPIPGRWSGNAFKYLTMTNRKLAFV